VLVAGIVGGDLGHQVGVEIAPVGDLRPIERLEDAGLDLAAEEVVGGHHQIVAGAARQQLGLEDLVAVEDVVDDLDTGLRGEIGEHLRVDIVRPVIDLHGPGLRAGRAGGEQGGGRNRSEGELAHGVSPAGEASSCREGRADTLLARRYRTAAPL